MYSHSAKFSCAMQADNRYYELLTGANLAFIDTHHVSNTAVYILTGQLPIMDQLLKIVYSVYVLFERDNLLAYPEPDEFNSDSHTISLSVVLILYCPLFPKNDFLIVTGSCHPYPI
jgi:hypothetical protein